MTAHQAGHPHYQRLPREVLPDQRQMAEHAAATGAAHGEDPLLLGVDIQHGPALQRCHIQHGGTQHTDLLVGGQHDLQPGMLHGGVLQRRQCHGYGDAVIAAQSCPLGAYQIAVRKEVQALLVHILGAARLLFAYHVHMALQDHRRGVLIARRGRGDQDHVVGFVLIMLQPQLFAKRHAPVADGLGVGGAVRNGAHLLKNFKYPLRF